MSDAGAITAAIREAHERAPIDILICNAGIIIPGHFDDVSTKDLEDTVTTNVLGSLYPIHAAIPLMKQRCGPNTPQSIVLVSSVAGLVSLRLQVKLQTYICYLHGGLHVPYRSACDTTTTSLSLYIYIYKNQSNSLFNLDDVATFSVCSLVGNNAQNNCS